MSINDIIHMEWWVVATVAYQGLTNNLKLDDIVNIEGYELWKS